MTPVTPNRKDSAVTHNVRVTQEPGVVREVDDRELVDLGLLGLIHSFERTPEAVALLPKGFSTDERWKAPAKGDEIVTADPLTTDAAEPVATKGK